ncbi:DUF3291 domain-containing protein [Roseitranquillus sediminis]|uniref:DUF3291 domain-containing protein n=1 Tax=Roseitranquillus sediminis TaxID=2809051 RepID=UPI001D0C3A61|nr:DUF3291 domain-containing protein [Roseitranquillus sediminis]MBM9594107.1 DUF3291 domain-containing protein [Roseitranquillus sediminis]
MKAARHIAHLNWGLLRADWDDPLVAPFVRAVDAVNAAAARAPGFVWRLPDEDGDWSPLGDSPRLAATLSVWKSAESLEAFVTRAVHGAFLSRRAEWFVPLDVPTYVIWPVAPGHRPTPAEGKARLDRLAADGAGPEDFDFAWQSRNRTEAGAA